MEIYVRLLTYQLVRVLCQDPVISRLNLKQDYVQYLVMNLEYFLGHLETKSSGILNLEMVNCYVSVVSSIFYEILQPFPLAWVQQRH